MGGSSSKPSETISQAPRSFYLVQGSPNIKYRYRKEDGPLIYHAEMESTAAESMVEHADSFQLTAAVSGKQSFMLVPRAEGPAKSASLSFDIYMLSAIKKLSVYASMSIAYVEKRGLVMRPIADHPHQPMCVYEESGLDVTTTRVTTTSPILYSVLREATLSTSISATRTSHDATEADDSATQYVTSAPLVIVVELPEIESTALPGLLTREEQERKRQANAANTHGEQTEDGLATDGGAAVQMAHSREESAGPAPQTFARVLQFTFLDLDRSAATPATTAAEPAPIALRVVKQLLQLGGEVYELNDVFDLGDMFQPGTEADDAVQEAGATASTGHADDDDDDNVCVVCLSNPKDTAILPCRHMCVCNECAGQLRLNNNKCPICRRSIERVLTM